MPQARFRFRFGGEHRRGNNEAVKRSLNEAFSKHQSSMGENRRAQTAEKWEKLNPYAR